MFLLQKGRPHFLTNLKKSDDYRMVFILIEYCRLMWLNIFFIAASEVGPFQKQVLRIVCNEMFSISYDSFIYMISIAGLSNQMSAHCHCCSMCSSASDWSIYREILLVVSENAFFQNEEAFFQKWRSHHLFEEYRLPFWRSYDVQWTW